jgi:anaerobic ribonucleoside-triphosphate reductase activating protein
MMLFGETEKNNMYYGNIKDYDIADGEGCRVTLFVSGCTNHCKDCFQRETWDFKFGNEYTDDTENEIIARLKKEMIQGLTLLGGEPFEPENQRVLVKLLRRVRRELPQKDIWSYTGFVLDKDLLEGQRKHCEVTDEMLSLLNVLVDGPFIAEKKNIALYFRGSENQRVIDMPKTLAEKKIVLYHS